MLGVFRIDDFRIKKVVDGLGSVVSFGDCLGVDKFARELGLDNVYCLCKEGSAATMELKADDRYVVRKCRS